MPLPRAGRCGIRAPSHLVLLAKENGCKVLFCPAEKKEDVEGLPARLFDGVELVAFFEAPRELATGAFR